MEGSVVLSPQGGGGEGGGQMEATRGAAATAAANPSRAVKFYYSKRHDTSGPMHERAATATASSARPVLLPDGDVCTNLQLPTSPSEELEVGSFYEIAHDHLPPKSPTQLKEIRVVMVGEKTKLGVTVNFPSILSLREYFNSESSTALPGDATAPPGRGKGKLRPPRPELDEQFVMSYNNARKILRRLVPSLELDSEQRLEKFWVVVPKFYELMCPLLTPEKKPGAFEEGRLSESKIEGAADSCLQALKSAKVVSWGVRRRVAYMGRHMGKDLFLSLCTGEAAPKPDNGEASCWPKKRVRRSGMSNKRNDSKKKKDNKRKRESDDGADSADTRKRCLKSARWSSERYAGAELKLVDIMKDKKAVLGNPILRSTLREEARKHIGDTGLLDHLLKHMAGKVVHDGKERLRRRHNPEGMMEYWLEPADLVEARRNAGMLDPSWAPPLGWKAEGTVSPFKLVSDGAEISKLNEEISSLRRMVEQMRHLKQEQQEKANEVQSESESGSAKSQDYNTLLLWKGKVEEQLIDIVASLHALKEDVQILREDMRQIKEHQAEDKKQTPNGPGEDEGRAKVVVDVDDDEKIKATSEQTPNSGSCYSKKHARAVRKSGFRICKPQGTFLWPSSMGAEEAPTSATAGAGGHSSSSCLSTVLSAAAGSPKKMAVPHDDVFGVPTPTSASSATSPALLPLPPATTGAAVTSPSPSRPARAAEAAVLCLRHRDLHSSLVPRGLVTPAALCGSEQWVLGLRDEGGELWGSTISTDLALASPSYHRI